MIIKILNENIYLIFFQKILLSNASNDNIPTKYAKKSKIIPKKSTENSNQNKKKFAYIFGEIKYVLKSE